MTEVAVSAGGERPPGTLGEQLALLGEYLRLRHVPVYAWAPGLAPVLRRLDVLTQSWGRRFARDEGEQGPAAAGLRRARTPGQARAGAEEPAQRTTAGSPTEHDTAGRPGLRSDRVLPADVRARLREVAGPGADGMRVHVDTSADAVARAHHADAVTMGTDVHVRSGQFRPDTAEGFALLAHEASHVTALLARGGAAHRITPGGRDEEEASATRIEQLARLSLGMHVVPVPAEGGGVPVAGFAAPPTGGPPAAQLPPFPAVPQPVVPSPGSAPAIAAAATPMRADADRGEATVPAPFDVEGLRRSLIDDLMHRLRTDFERGG